jgi:hypothetical protein
MTTRPGYVWDATASEWVEIGQAAVVSPFKYQTSQPSSPATGDIWIDSDEDVPSVDSTLYYRWTKTMSGGETSLSGTDNNSLALKYTPGYESVFINGVLQVRGSDYVATTGTTVTGLIALTANDVVMVESIIAYSVGDTYTQSTLDGKFATQVDFPAGAWTAYTPTLTGFTLGTGGTMTARYTKIGKTVHGYVNITLGTSFTMTALQLSLPVAKQASTTYVNATWTLVSVGAGDWPALNRYENSDVISAYAMTANSTFVNPSVFSTTIPFTWKSTDKILVAFTYEAA